jgi:hypothetical protein
MSIQTSLVRMQKLNFFEIIFFVIKQEVMERTNPATFLTLLNNAVINLNHLVQELLKGTHGQTNLFVIYFTTLFQ